MEVSACSRETSSFILNFSSEFQGKTKVREAEEEAEPSAQTARLVSPNEREHYLELSRRPVATICDCCGAEATEGVKKLQRCSTCRRKAYCSAACQLKDWKEGGHKRSCRPRKDLRADDVVVVQGFESHSELNGQLMVVVRPANEKGRWLVMDERRKSTSLHVDKLRLVAAVEERKDVITFWHNIFIGIY